MAGTLRGWKRKNRQMSSLEPSEKTSLANMLISALAPTTDRERIKLCSDLPSLWLLL